MQSSHTYATNSLEWNKIFPLLDEESASKIKGKLKFGYFEYFDYTIPESLDYKRKDHYKTEYSDKNLPKFLVPRQYSRPNYVDKLIKWDKFILDPFETNYYPLYDLIASKEPEYNIGDEAQQFCTLGKCYLTKMLDCVEPLE